MSWTGSSERWTRSAARRARAPAAGAALLSPSRRCRPAFPLSVRQQARCATRCRAPAVLLHVGTSWDADSLALEQALSSQQVEQALQARGVLQGKVCYETGQRWLMECDPSLHHCGLTNR